MMSVFSLISTFLFEYNIWVLSVNCVVSKGCRGLLPFPITYDTFWQKFGSLQELNLKFKMYET